VVTSGVGRSLYDFSPLDSDGGFDLLLPDLAPIAAGNFGVRYLEHVTHRLS